MNRYRQPVAAVLLTSLLAFAHPTSALALERSQLPPPTSEGSFAGTWYYVDPGFRIAIFITNDKGRVRLKYHVLPSQGPEIETDERGYGRGSDGSNIVEIRVTGSLARDGVRMEGRYQRTVTAPEGRFKEEGNFQIWRSEGGQKLVLFYPEYSSTVTDPSGRKTKKSRTDVSLLFRKASDIVLGFHEIPF